MIGLLIAYSFLEFSSRKGSNQQSGVQLPFLKLVCENYLNHNMAFQLETLEYNLRQIKIPIKAEFFLKLQS